MINRIAQLIADGMSDAERSQLLFVHDGERALDQDVTMLETLRLVERKPGEQTMRLTELGQLVVACLAGGHAGS